MKIPKEKPETKLDRKEMLKTIEYYIKEKQEKLKEIEEDLEELRNTRKKIKRSI